VTEFKDAGLEYLCLQLESMLENHLIDDLDEDLLLELDEVVRGNQLNCLPFAKSGRADLLLHERHPNLAGDIDEERQRRVRDMIFRAGLREDDNRLSSSFRARVGSLDDLMSSSPSHEKLRNKSKIARNAPFSPSIRPKDSNMDLMFDMDDEDPFGLGSPKSPTPTLAPKFDLTPTKTDSATWNELDPQDKLDDDQSYLPSRPTGLDNLNGNENPPSNQNTKTWSSPGLPSSKLDMREIMAQASTSRISNLSMSLSAQKDKDQNVMKSSAPKLSQKERKKRQQQALQQALDQPQITVDKADGQPFSPWQVATSGPRTSLKDVLSESQTSPLQLATNPLGSPVISQPLTPRRNASPDTRFPGQRRNVNVNAGPKRGSSPMDISHSSKPTSLVPHSKSYNTPPAKAEPSLQLSMADIIGQQRREQEVIKEAVAKRSLQEIQEEQAFQEWWDQESKKAQEEAARARASPSGRGGKTGGGRGKGGPRGRGGRGRGDSTRGGTRSRGQDKTTNRGEKLQ